MTTLLLQPFALREGRLSPGLSPDEIHETMRHAHGYVLAVSKSRVKMSWDKAVTLDLPEPTFGGSVPATSESKAMVNGKLRNHEYLRRPLPQGRVGQINVFFVWDFAPQQEGKLISQPKGLTMTSHSVMILGSKLPLQLRGRSTAHEIGHALLGSHEGVHRKDDKGNLMFPEVEDVGAKLDAEQERVFVRNAALVAVGTNILYSQWQYVKPP